MSDYALLLSFQMATSGSGLHYRLSTVPESQTWEEDDFVQEGARSFTSNSTPSRQGSAELDPARRPRTCVLHVTCACCV